MKKNIKIIIMCIIVLLCSFLYAHIDKKNVIYDRTYDDSDYTSIASVPYGVLKQTFIVQEDKLDGVTVKTIVSGDVSDVELEYVITDIESGKEYEGTVSGEDFKNNKYYQFEVGKQLTGCKGKAYSIEIEEKGATDSNGIGFYLTPTANKDTTLDLNGESMENTVIMKTVTNRFDFETFVVVLICILFIWAFMRVLYRLFNK